MPHPALPEPTWSKVDSTSSPIYTRPLLGSEYIHDLAHRFSDGLGEVCMGLSFKTTLSESELLKRTKESIGRLRFIIPILACSIETDESDLFARHWKFRPLPNASGIDDWVNETLTIRLGTFDTEKFMAEMNGRRLPYIHFDGFEQPVHFYLLSDAATGFHAIYMHGPHTIMDARPALVCLNTILQWIAFPPDERLADLTWGTEWERLPPGPLAATGGARDDWDESGVQLMQEVGNIMMDPNPSLSLRPTRDAVENVGNMVRLHKTFDGEMSVKVLKTIKAAGFTVSQLGDAALVLSLFETRSADSLKADDAHVTLDPVVISQERFLTAEHKGPSHCVAGLVMVPIRVAYGDIPQGASRKQRLLAIMSTIKKQYDHFLENPNLPHLFPAQLALFPPRTASDFRNQHASILTNIGAVESYVNAGRLREAADAKLDVVDLFVGHRLGWQRHMNHIWSLNGKIHFQIEVSDVWDKVALEAHLESMTKIFFSILDDGREEALVTTPQTNGMDVAKYCQNMPEEGEEFKGFPHPCYQFTKAGHNKPYPAIDPLLADLSGRVVVITGASGGIGRETVLAFAKAGASGIVITGRSLESLDSVEAEVKTIVAQTQRAQHGGTSVLKIAMDITDEDAVRAAAEKTKSEFGKLDVLVNLAGRMDGVLPMSASDHDDWWGTMNVNVRGTYLVTRAFLPLLLVEDSSKIIINTTSFSGLLTNALISAYSMSKLVILRMSEILQEEHNDSGLSVYAVHPGFVRTAMTANLPEMMSAILVDSPVLGANTFVWLAKEKRAWLHGRYVSCTWDVTELEARKEEIVKGDKLKYKLVM